MTEEIKRVATTEIQIVFNVFFILSVNVLFCMLPPLSRDLFLFTFALVHCVYPILSTVTKIQRNECTEKSIEKKKIENESNLLFWIFVFLIQTNSTDVASMSSK